MKKLLMFIFMLSCVIFVYSQNEIIQTIPPGGSAVFIEYKSFPSTQAILDAIRAGKSTKIKFLYSGDQYVVLGVDKETPMLWSSYVLVERVKGNKRIKGWMSTKDIGDRTPLASSFPVGDFPAVRDEYMSAIKYKVVIPGMNKSEVFLATNIYRDAAKVINGYEVWNDPGLGSTVNSSLYFYEGELYKSIGKFGNFYYQANVQCELVKVECSEELFQTDMSDLGVGVYEDENVHFKWEVNQKELSFSLTNKCKTTMKIDWNEVLYIDQLNISKRIIHKGVKLNDKEEYQTPSIIARSSRLADILVPVDNIEYDKFLKDWTLCDLFKLASPNDNIGKGIIGENIRVLLPIMLKDKQLEYTFVFQIKNVDFELIRNNAERKDVY